MHITAQGSSDIIGSVDELTETAVCHYCDIFCEEYDTIDELHQWVIDHFTEEHSDIAEDRTAELIAADHDVNEEQLTYAQLFAMP